MITTVIIVNGMQTDTTSGSLGIIMTALITMFTEKSKDAFSSEQLMKQQDLKEAIRKQMEELFLAKGVGSISSQESKGIQD